MESAEKKNAHQESDTPHRSRGANLVHEARIAKAGGGIPGISSYYQAMLYLVVLAALGGAIWWAFSQGGP
jgi:hypothetical protein